MTEELERYILGHISPEPDHLARLYRHTHIHNLYPRMCSGHLQGRILAMLASMIRPRKALELGTFTGYSALALAEGMEVGSELHTIEINDESEDDLLGLFASKPASVRGEIILHVGDALDVIPRLGVDDWDLVYIDANKRNYVDYLGLVLPRMKRGGFIIADNTLWDGKVADGEEHRDPQTLGILAFNDAVAANPRLETCILPLRDGLSLIRVAPEL